MRMIKMIGMLVFFLSVFSTAALAQFQYPRFQWEKSTHDFGELTHKSAVSYEFEFTNKGQAPLVIAEVEPSCGCTVTEYTREPIMPGKKGKVKASFDSASLGKFNKSIKVTANVEGGPEYLYIRGTVVNTATQ